MLGLVVDPDPNRTTQHLPPIYTDIWRQCTDNVEQEEAMWCDSLPCQRLIPPRKRTKIDTFVKPQLTQRTALQKDPSFLKTSSSWSVVYAASRLLLHIRKLSKNVQKYVRNETSIVEIKCCSEGQRKPSVEGHWATRAVIGFILQRSHSFIRTQHPCSY